MNETAQSEQLVDICDVSIDGSLSKQERIDEYIRQIKDPYNFKCGKFTVRACFTENSPSLEDCLKRVMN